MAATRLLRTSRPLGLSRPSSSSLYCSSNYTKVSLTAPVRHLNTTLGENREMTAGGSCDQKKPLLAVKAAVATSEKVILSTNLESQMTGRRVVVDLASFLTKVANTTLIILKLATKRRRLRLQAQLFIERGIVDCRFFTFFAVAGSLLGSVLCFLEGCFITMESYFQYFHAISQKSDQGHVMQLLIEAIDMYMVGTAMLVFGMGLHVMFMGTRDLKGKGSLPLPAGSNFFGLFHLNKLPRWACMQSVTQAKSKIGHAVIMILQVGVVEKFRSIPMVTALDLACFAGAILVSSASVFLLSRLSAGDVISDTT